jgi:hypothetical protein
MERWPSLSKWGHLSSLPKGWVWRCHPIDGPIQQGRVTEGPPASGYRCLIIASHASPVWRCFLLLLLVDASACLMASSGLPRARRVAVIVASSFHIWRCGRFMLGLGVLAGMGHLLTSFQDRRRGSPQLTL